MSGVVTPPPRPPRPYLPTHNRKDGAKSADLPSPGELSVSSKMKAKFQWCSYQQIRQVSLNDRIHLVVVVIVHYVLNVQSGSRELDPSPPLVERTSLQRDQLHLSVNW